MGQNPGNRRQRDHAEAEFMRKWLHYLGGGEDSHEARVRRINALFEERTRTIYATYHADVTQRQNDYRYAFFTVTRSLASMSFRELTFLKLAELLNSWCAGSYLPYRKWRAALIWGDGKGSTDGWWTHDIENCSSIEQAVTQALPKVDATINALQQELRSLLSRRDLSADFRATLEEFADDVAPTGGAGWLKPSEVATSPFRWQSNYALHIGSFSDGTPLTYSGEKSMVTIAAPGSGKTQCNVLPNLLTWTGPAVVLDIAGDIYGKTAAWRAKNVGPVYRFSPLDPDHSHKYSPLSFVDRDPRFIWKDSRALGNMMIVPTLADDPFWENEARTAVTTVIAYVCYFNPPEQRPMKAVLKVLFDRRAWDAMILKLAGVVDVPELPQHASALAQQNDEALRSVLQVARSSLSAWSGSLIEGVTSKADWSPSVLRDGSNSTVYICIKPGQVESYLSVLRVFIGQHIRMLVDGPEPPTPVLLMLDEFPQLRNMPPVEEALDTGRNQGLRLWIFAQTLGQLKKHYADAEGLLAKCGVQIYMNPSGADGLAETVSEQLGYVESINDNSRRRLVEAAELAGPAYSDRQIVIASGSKPAAVSKDFAHEDPELEAIMKGSTQTAITQASKRIVTCPHCGAKQRIPATAIKFRCCNPKCNTVTVA